ncbi:GntR family transcriptional regulator [Streptomyces sp. H27-D2]|uniref:GntR family transcriptional regulator n=1 Tax=Streptomyces sp. H27-D2 TaxID=3046304 RepID=UPI002DBA390F|nr:GntR family transcriptional regulator [Streptomyces sp. H27-D2]MEC4018876.1 GntR family transcriptional regulator [Streptomyces sp. H27-D2]
MKIADELRRRIQDGELGPGEKIPSERQICEQWEVSSITARAAVSALRNEGLVESARGKGTFVRHKVPLVRIAPQRYFREQHKPTYVLEAERARRSVAAPRVTTEESASAGIAERLGIDPGDPVTRTSMTVSMDREIVSMSVTWEPMALTGGTDIVHPAEGPHAGKGLIDRFDIIGYQVDEVEEILDCRMPSQGEIRSLSITGGVPVVAIRQTWRAGDRPVATVDIVFPADRYEFHYRMTIPTSSGAGPVARVAN